MPFFEQSYQDLMTDSLTDLTSATRVTRASAGSIARSVLEAANRRLSEAYTVFNLGLARILVSSATGQFLELIGTLLGVERLPATPAGADTDTQVVKLFVDSGTFGDINGGQNITVRQNKMISTLPYGGGIVYRVAAETVLPASANLAWVPVVASSVGEASNVGSGTLLYHDIVEYTGYQNASLKVTNIYPIANGTDVESDANYRYRIVNQTLVGEAANQTALRLAALTTPGVADIIMVSQYRGIGTYGLIIKATTPIVSQAILDSVTANALRVQAFGSTAYVRAPKQTGLAAKITVTYDTHLAETELTGIESAIRDSITAYVNNLDIGEVFFYNRMVSDIYRISPHIVSLGVEPGRPVDQLWIYTDSLTADNRVRQTLLGNYEPAADERVIIEQTLSQPITLERKYVGR